MKFKRNTEKAWKKEKTWICVWWRYCGWFPIHSRKWCCYDGVLLMVLQHLQVRVEWVSVFRPWHYPALLWFYLHNCHRKLTTCTERHDPQNHFQHSDPHGSSFTRHMYLHIVLSYRVWISGLHTHFFHSFSPSIQIFSPSLSHTDIWLQSVILFFVNSLCKSCIFTFCCLPTNALCSLSLLTFDWGSDLRLRAPRRLHISGMDSLLWFTER